MNIWKTKQPYPSNFGVWKKGLTPEIQWFWLKKLNTPKYFDSRCNLYLEEKIQLMIYPDPRKLLNQIWDLIARCRHRNKSKLLTNVKDNV